MQCIIVFGGMECVVCHEGCTQLPFGILYMNGEVGLGLF
jgi:hypothetical protein